MTRYALPAAAKSSHQRVPNKGTPWSKLKNPKTSTKPSSKKISWKGDSIVEAEELEHEQPTPKTTKKRNRDQKEYKRRKPLTDIPSIHKDGTEIAIVRFEGFPVTKTDFDRLRDIKQKLLASKVPHSEIKKTMKLERRRAEKALARMKNKLCFHCRNSGHVLSECPQLKNEPTEGTERMETGICFKCGSTEHQHLQCHIRGDVYKHAVCFICKQEGHISKQCPDNPRGLYPEGGGCNICGDITHFKKDCKKFSKKKKEEFEVTVKTLDNRISDALDEDLDVPKICSPQKKKKKLVKM